MYIIMCRPVKQLLLDICHKAFDLTNQNCETQKYYRVMNYLTPIQK